MLVGYARVSTSEQETDLQFDALHRAGVRKMFTEKASSVGSRPVLRQALVHLSPGDRLVVYKLDRVARSLKDLLLILEQLERVGAGFSSLTEPIDTSNPAGRLMLQMLGAVAEFERTLIRERAIAGQVAAYRRGVRWGGQPAVVTAEDAAEIVRLRDTGLFTIPLLADMFSCSESTIWRTIWIKQKPHAAKLSHRNLPVLRRYL